MWNLSQSPILRLHLYAAQGDNCIWLFSVRQEMGWISRERVGMTLWGPNSEVKKFDALREFIYLFFFMN